MNARTVSARLDTDIEWDVTLALTGLVGDDRRDILESGIVYAVVVVDGVARILLDDRIEFDRLEVSGLPHLIESSLCAIPGLRRVIVKPRPRSIRRSDALPGIAHIVGIHSGKGGVGKSTTTAYIATSLALDGLRVGVLDADVYGPSQHLLLGPVADLVTDPERNLLIPARSPAGVRVVSLGMILPDDRPLMWRGSLIDEGISQLIRDVAWGELDLLLVDLPPGTGDVHMALSRDLPFTGIVSVSTPHELALLDTQRGLEFFADLQTPCLGLVETMGPMRCACGHCLPLFGAGATLDLARRLGVTPLGEVPFDPAVVQASEQGRLLEQGPAVEAMRAVAARVIQQLPPRTSQAAAG